MKRNNFFSRFIVVTLIAALLLVSGSRAIRVSALADPVQAISPVFDTQIYQLSDYVDHLPEPSLDIFYILTGVLFVSQLGAEKYKLIDPYANKAGVINWFKSMGVRAYNTLIGLAPSVDPILGFDVRPYVKPLVAALMGNAVMAANYSSVEDFMESEDQVLVPFKKDIQDSINVIWQIQGGPYHWQFDSDDFVSEFTWNTTDLGASEYQYNNYLDTMEEPLMRSNMFSYYRNYVISMENFSDYTNLFLNSSSGQFYVCNSAGQPLPNATYNGNQYNIGNTQQLFIHTFADNAIYFGSYPTYLTFSGTLQLNDFNTMLEAVKYIFNYDQYNCMSDLVKHAYIGTNWINKQEIFNLTDLNIDDTGDPFYDSPVDDGNDVFIDIKNLINDLVDQTDIWNKIILNITDPDGTIRLPEFIKISVDLTPITELLDPPIPVNLNEIAELTDNSYLERIKEEAQRGGNALAYLVAFWHNCDAELIYVLFGAGITVLVGAFIGKWGHS